MCRHQQPNHLTTYVPLQSTRLIHQESIKSKRKASKTQQSATRSASQLGIKRTIMASIAELAVQQV